MSLPGRRKGHSRNALTQGYPFVGYSFGYLQLCCRQLQVPKGSFETASINLAHAGYALVVVSQRFWLTTTLQAAHWMTCWCALSACFRPVGALLMCTLA